MIGTPYRERAVVFFPFPALVVYSHSWILGAPSLSGNPAYHISHTVMKKQ